MTDLKQNYLTFQQSLEDWLNQKRQTLDGYKRNYQDKTNALKDQHQSLVLFQKSLEKKQAQLLMEIQQYNTKKDDLSLDLQEITIKEEQQFNQLQEINRTVSNLQLEINQKIKEQQKIETMQKERQAIAQPTLRFYQKILSLYIEPLGDGHNKFTFKNIDKKDPQKEYYFSILTSDKFNLVACNPPIDELDGMMKRLNETRDFYGFIKQVRRCWQSQ
ncbi:kinetochore-associated Ndc80 complex subunit spc25 [Boothiomyces sp. JEL0866]|nr:kinetochore-associated Ndc80 complex subunit spc25 [Boothiomyces sp. JEL0866]